MLDDRKQLSHRQSEVVGYIRRSGPFGQTASQIADAFNTSVQSASTQLRSLYLRGFLDRKTLIQPSGGVEYAYAVVGV